MHDPEIVNADVGELRAARYLADRPNAGCRRLQAFIDFDVSTVGQLDAGQLQPKSLGVRSAACRHQHVTALQDLLRPIVLDDEAHRVSRFSRYPLDTCTQKK